MDADRDALVAAARRICQHNPGSGYCSMVGGSLGCKVGRGEGPTEDASGCKMPDAAVLLTGEYAMALAALAPVADDATVERCKALEAAVKVAMDQFLFYEASHRAKGTADGHAKADVNRALAEKMAAALAAMSAQS